MLWFTVHVPKRARKIDLISVFEIKESVIPLNFAKLKLARSSNVFYATFISS